VSDNREPLLDELARGWSTWDPMPADLPDRILTAIALADVDDAYELLTLTTRSDSLLGARGNADDRTLIEFQADGVQVLVRVGEASGTGRRLDGWVEPAGLLGVTLRQADAASTGRVTSASRFEFDAVPHGLSRLELELADADSVRKFRSPHFEI